MILQIAFLTRFQNSCHPAHGPAGAACSLSAEGARVRAGTVGIAEGCLADEAGADPLGQEPPMESGGGQAIYTE